MKIIGLTGPSGAGKQLVSACFAEYGIPSIDTDRVYHDLLIPPSACATELVARFGPTVADTQGGIDRRALSAIVFAPGGERDLADLNRITHRYVWQETEEQLKAFQANGCPAVILDAPALLDSDFPSYCHVIVSVLADFDTRLRRIMVRDGIDEEYASKRLTAQHDDAFFIEHSHYVLYNDGEPSALRPGVESILRKEGLL